jgi:hypothetical protein
MRTYTIYLVKEEIAIDYVGKESLLFQLFNQFQGSTSYSKDIIEKQVAFITQLIPMMQLQEHLKHSLQSYLYYKADEHEHHLHMPDEQAQAKLILHERYIEIRAKGNPTAETIFFEQLRKKISAFFAMDSSRQFYGWLAPIRQKIPL